MESKGQKLLGGLGKPFDRSLLDELLLERLTAVSSARKTLSSTISLTKKELRQALLEEQFVPYYQPKFSLETGIVIGVEVLARWHHPKHGILLPSVFLTNLSRYALMDSLLSSQLQAGLALQSKAWQLGHQLNFAFNLEAHQLNDHSFASRVQAVLIECNMPASGLTFEITESGRLELSATTLKNLVRLRMMGCGFSIDDFGAGFSSLQRLCQIPFNEIKLDAEFVRGLFHDPRCSAVIKSTLVLGEALGMWVVIEGVETELQRKTLLALGCKIGQGYVCAKPMHGADLLEWMGTTH